MPPRLQRTIARPAGFTGIGFLSGADIQIRFLPAQPHAGIAFQRTDRSGSLPVPALVEYTVPRQRRTAIERYGVAIEMVEHVMAALAGLQIDNCLVQLNGPEPPGCDGSSRQFAETLLDAGIVEQDAPRKLLVNEHSLRIPSEDRRSEITAAAISRRVYAITYHLDYGPRSPIRPQTRTVEITPETFLKELAFARTFILESEADALRAQGYGRRTTAKDLLIFGPEGPIENHLHAVDECARHKILDCLGDFALLGCDLQGHFSAWRSGHRLNQEMVRQLKLAHPQAFATAESRAA